MAEYKINTEKAEGRVHYRIEENLFDKKNFKVHILVHAITHRDAMETVFELMKHIKDINGPRVYPTP